MNVTALATSAIAGLPATEAQQYLRGYLDDIHVSMVVEEPRYFDRDFLADFSAFYGVSARAYPNVCRRLHFFADDVVSRELLQHALNGREDAIEKLAKSYRGFTVLRPLDHAPFGRTVLAMYDGARVDQPARQYTVHLAGLRLSVRGIAWQQQDRGVAACATVALWSMLQSSAFDEHHAIPTAADVTRLANRSGDSVGRIFPSEGLNLRQLSAAIRAAGLEPIVIEGDRDARFSAGAFTPQLACLIRSGFPVLIACGGQPGQSGHAVCAVAFRETASPAEVAGEVRTQDEHIEALFIHDDNYGPNVRFQVQDELQPASSSASVVTLISNPPERALARGSVTANRTPLRPYALAAAVPEGLRVKPGTVDKTARALGKGLLLYINSLQRAQGQGEVGFSSTLRFCRTATYLRELLPAAAGPHAGAARLAFVEEVPPPSLFLAVARMGVAGRPYFDLVFDTSNGDHNLSPWATITFDPHVDAALRALVTARNKPIYGTIVPAF